MIFAYEEDVVCLYDDDENLKVRIEDEDVMRNIAAYLNEAKEEGHLKEDAVYDAYSADIGHIRLMLANGVLNIQDMDREPGENLIAVYEEDDLIQVPLCFDMIVRELPNIPVREGDDMRDYVLGEVLESELDPD